LEKVFPPEAVEKLTKKEVKVKLIYCPAGTKAVAVVFPQKEWIDRDPQILRGFYCARGYKAKIFPEARRLVLESGTADLNELPFKRFEQQGCTIEFIV
jgi:hypothetical protein